MLPKILVIGSGDHDRAECVDWLQPFPNIEEYDSIIINLQSLTQETYDKIQRKICEMKESINIVFDTNREIFCIMNKLIEPSPPPSRPGEPRFKAIRLGYVSPTNYDWLPMTIEVSSQKKGTSINICNPIFEKYFELIDRWNLEITISPQTIRDVIGTLRYSIFPIAINKSQRTIAGSLKHASLDGKVLPGHEKGAIHLLPPPTRSSTFQTIELILDLIFGEEVKIIQPWRKEIEVPKEREFENEIEKKITTIKRIQEEISQLRNQIQEWGSYRDLLTTTGNDLENIVQRTLADMGIKTEKTAKGFPADLISKEVAVEITGIKGCVGVGSEKVNQTGRFKESYHKVEKIILIANTYVDLPPKDRKGKMNFSPEVKKYFESLSICCLTTMTLFELWKEVIAGKKDQKDIKKKILAKNGELTLSEFKRI
jgi:hypothetical protein